MEHSPSWEANRCSASQKIPRILWNPKVHYRIYKCPPPFTIVSHTNSSQATPFHSLKIYFNIMFPSTPRSPKWSLSITSPHQSPVYTSRFTICSYPSHFLWFFQPNNICGEVQITVLYTPTYTNTSFFIGLIPKSLHKPQMKCVLCKPQASL